MKLLSRYLTVAIGVCYFSTICFAQAPVNDECAGATSLALTAFGSTCNVVMAANTNGATKSSPNPSCTSSLNDDDIWYSFEATGASVVLRVFNTTYNGSGQKGQMGFSLYEGACPGAATNLHCSNLITAGYGFLIINDLIPGTTYYLRFWSASATESATFEFCMQEVVQPANDECENATQILSEAVGTICDATYHATTVGATPSAPDVSCSNFTDDDIWYSFTANTNAARINFTNATQATVPSPGNANLGYAIYEANCPSSNVALNCNGNIGSGSGSELIGGLTPGSMYFLRLFSFGENNYVTFDFCVTDVDVPANDECTKAVDVPVSAGFCTSPVGGTLFNAVTSAGFGAPACVTGSSSEDVWYKTTVPASGNITIQTSAADSHVPDLVLEAYAGSCGILSLVTCDDDSNPDEVPSSLHARIVLTGRTPGERIYLRVLGKFGNNYGPFAICAWDHSIAVPVSPGGDCIDANAVTINTASVNKYMWVPVFDNNRKIIAEIYSDGEDMNETNVSIYKNTSGIVRSVNGAFYLDRNIAIVPANNHSAKVRMYFTHDDMIALQAADPSVISMSSLNVTKTNTVCEPAFSGPGSIIIPSAYTDYGANHYVEFLTPSFSSFYLNSANVVLPLKFLSVDAVKTNTSVQLRWKVVKDNSIRNFEIVFSYDGSNFQLLDLVNPREFVSEENNVWAYIFNDRRSYNGQVYYKVKMQDINGKIIYSPVVSINLFNAGKRIFSVYPNPTPGKFYVTNSDNRVHISAQLLSTSGQSVKDFGKITNTLNVSQLDVADVPPGMYLLRITDLSNEQVYYRKLIKR